MLNNINSIYVSLREIETGEPREMQESEDERRGEARAPARVEETRRRVEKMAVEENEQAGGILRSMAGRAKEGWERMRKMLDGKKLVWKGNSGRIVAVTKEREGVEDKDMNVEDELDGGTVEIEREESGEETVSGGDGVSLRSRDADSVCVDLEFLEGIDFDERDKELDEREGDSRKRKSSGDEDKKMKLGLGGLPGWERRSKAVKDSERWTRKTVRVERDEEGKEKRVERQERVPLPESFELGREGKGMEMNNSGRLKNNFGMNKEALFPVNSGMKSEKRNWIASFTKTGCVSCRDENGRLNHKGRDGQPNVLIVGMNRFRVRSDTLAVTGME
jgi:hypothetical protein